MFLTMRPITFICILLFTTAAVILVCSLVEQHYGLSSSRSASPPPTASTQQSQRQQRYKKDHPSQHNVASKAEKKHEAGKQFLTLAEGKVPAFKDVFDEETFYIFAGCVALGSCVLAFIASRFLTLTDPDDPDEILRRVRKWKLRNTEHGLPVLDGDSASAATVDTTASAFNAETTLQESPGREDDDDDDFDDDDDSEEERELLRSYEEKFFRDRSQRAESADAKTAQ